MCLTSLLLCGLKEEIFPVRGHKTVPQKQEVNYLENFPTSNIPLVPRNLESVVILTNRSGCGT